MNGVGTRGVRLDLGLRIRRGADGEKTGDKCSSGKFHSSYHSNQINNPMGTAKMPITINIA